MTKKKKKDEWTPIEPEKAMDHIKSMLNPFEETTEGKISNLKKEIDKIKKEKLNEFDAIVRHLLNLYGVRFVTIKQEKDKDEINFKFIGEFEDGVKITLTIEGEK